MPRARYHLVVVGGGPAGLVSAMGAAGLGARDALVEREMLGGDFLVTGNVNADLAADFAIVVRIYLASLRAADFLL